MGQVKSSKGGGVPCRFIMKVNKKLFAIFICVLICVLMLYFILRVPSIATAFVCRSPLRRLAVYSWDVGNGKPKSIRASMSFHENDCVINVSGQGAMRDITNENNTQAWRTFFTMSAGWIVSITKLNVTEGVTSVGRNSFAGCIKLSDVTLPASITNIRQHSFSQCKSLDTITYNGSIEEWGNVVLDEGWNSGSGDITVVCTDGFVFERGGMTNGSST